MLKTECMYLESVDPRMWTPHGLCSDSAVLNSFYLETINSLQVWVGDVLVGSKFFLEISASTASKFLWK